MRASDLAGRLPLPDSVKERMPTTPDAQIAVVRLEGVIAPSASPVARRGGINLEALEQTLVKAFELPNLQAVALAINSPGGAPTQSALVADRIRGLAAEKQVPVIAFCEDVAASGGYWLACAADEIIAHQTSLVGSIGVVSGGFGLHEAIARYGIERRIHTAGENKRRLDPFLPEQEEDVAWLRGELDELHGMFTGWVTERRGAKLQGDRDHLFSGEIWTGQKALEHGLIDGLGTLRGVLAERYPEAKIEPVTAKRSLLKIGLGGAGASAGLAESVPALLDALEDRSLWARFGL